MTHNVRTLNSNHYHDNYYSHNVLTLYFDLYSNQTIAHHLVSKHSLRQRQRKIRCTYGCTVGDQHEKILQISICDILAIKQRLEQT